jgi:hypothetical protein
MGNITCLTGPVETVDGKLVLRIPLAAGGSELVACSRGIGEVEGDFLSIVIEEWLAEKLGIAEATSVVVDNTNGRLNIRRE